MGHFKKKSIFLSNYAKKIFRHESPNFSCLTKSSHYSRVGTSRIVRFTPINTK